MKRRTSTPSKATPSKRPKDVFLVEKVVDMRKTSKGLEYLVAWQGFPKATDNTWEPAENIFDAALISDFEASLMLRSAMLATINPKASVAAPTPKAAMSNKKPKAAAGKLTMKVMPATEPAVDVAGTSKATVAAPVAETQMQTLLAPSKLLVLIPAAIGLVFLISVGVGFFRV
jgi:hypothetical protein